MFLKLEVYVPKTHTMQLLAALDNAGAGHIGDYDSCSFITSGTGRFRPLEGSDPFIGNIGEVEVVEEDKIEVVCPKDKMDDILEAMRQAHPYEEIAYFIIPIVNHEYEK